MTSKVVYQGELRTVLTHLGSGQEIITDAPIDNHGKGRAFSPTDLLATSLGACILTVLGIRAEGLGLDISGSQVSVEKKMADNPRRVARINIDVTIYGVSEPSRQKLFERIAMQCPVAKSLHLEIEQAYNFEFSTQRETSSEMGWFCSWISTLLKVSVGHFTLWQALERTTTAAIPRNILNAFMSVFKR